MFIDFSVQKDRISWFIHIHSHLPNSQKLRAQLEANAVKTNMVAAASTQMLKPQYCNDFYFYFWHSEFLVVLQFGKLSYHQILYVYFG